MVDALGLRIGRPPFANARCWFNAIVLIQSFNSFEIKSRWRGQQVQPAPLLQNIFVPLSDLLRSILNGFFMFTKLWIWSDKASFFTKVKRSVCQLQNKTTLGKFWQDPTTCATESFSSLVDVCYSPSTIFWNNYNLVYLVVSVNIKFSFTIFFKIIVITV